MKLHVLLRNAGVASRRKAEELIAMGKVTVNGKIGTIGQIVDGTEDITVRGKRIGATEHEKVYYVVNKPVGFTSTTAFFPSERSIIELLPRGERLKQWQIAGRLDKNSEGLVLITNDGQAVLFLTHPRYQVKKIYEVLLSEVLESRDMEQLKQGIGDYIFSGIQKLGPVGSYKVTLQEGKKREIREAFGMLNKRVISLKRVQMGPLVLGDLQTGEAFRLAGSELKELQAFLSRFNRASMVND